MLPAEQLASNGFGSKAKIEAKLVEYLTPEERLIVLNDRKRAVLREREAMIIDAAVQRALETPEDSKQFQEITTGLRRCEVALRALDAMAEKLAQEASHDRPD